MKSVVILFLLLFVGLAQAEPVWIFVENEYRAPGCIRHVQAFMSATKPTGAKLAELIQLKTYTYFLVDSLLPGRKMLYFVGRHLRWSFKCEVWPKIGCPHKVFKQSEGLCDSDVCVGEPVYCENAGVMREWADA